MLNIYEGMNWPPSSIIYEKMKEHSAWFSGSAEVIANYYGMISREYNNLLGQQLMPMNKAQFWGRNLNMQGEVKLHIPIAGDIASTSSDLLFSESPIIRYEGEQKDSIQGLLDEVLIGSELYSKIVEGAEISAALGGVYLKLAWDKELSEYPIVVIEQPDFAIPEFRFGMLQSVCFWKEIKFMDNSQSKIYRLLETYGKGYIKNELYLGTSDKLGHKVELNSINETKDLENELETNVDMLLAVYVPNMLPNRLLRISYQGKSDYLGEEGLFDSLDETFSNWISDISLAKGRIFIPSKLINPNGNFDLDKTAYVELEGDPLNNDMISFNQFDIRATQYEMTAKNLIERIITSAGYSPQTFGLNIEGRAESGTALNLREKKSFNTKAKKENYWHKELMNLVRGIILIYNTHLGGKLDPNKKINVSFNDSIGFSLTEVAQSVQMLSSAKAASIETRVKLVHPDWSDTDVTNEVQKILDEEKQTYADIPDFNEDYTEFIRKYGEENGNVEGKEKGSK